MARSLSISPEFRQKLVNFIEFHLNILYFKYYHKIRWFFKNKFVDAHFISMHTLWWCQWPLCIPVLCLRKFTKTYDFATLTFTAFEVKQTRLSWKNTRVWHHMNSQHQLHFKKLYRIIKHGEINNCGRPHSCRAWTFPYHFCIMQHASGTKFENNMEISKHWFAAIAYLAMLFIVQLTHCCKYKPVEKWIT